MSSSPDDDAMDQDEESEEDDEGEAALHLLRWQQYAQVHPAPTHKQLYVARSPDHGRVRVFVQRPSSSEPVASDGSVCVSSRASSSSLSSVATAAVTTKAGSPRGPPASLSVLLQAASDDDTVVRWLES